MQKLYFLLALTAASFLLPAQTVGPLTTTNWNQGCYYNDSCPAISGGPCGKAYTGCGATALAMTMKYYNYPTSGRGSYTYTPPGFAAQTANFAGTTYNWAAMPNSLSANNTNVAQIMYHSGVALDMGYGSSGSYCSFDASNVLKQIFKYSLSTRSVMKAMYTNTQWENLIKAEIDAGRVVYLNGGSHFYLCDGYQTSPTLKFHINFGWGGSYNGYYDIHNVIAASTNFTPGNIIVGIKPMANLEASPDTVTITNGAQNAYYIINSLTNWTASSNQTWFTPLLLSGTPNYYSTTGAATLNNSYSPRYATVTITDGTLTANVVIKQNGIAPMLYTSPSLLTYSSSGSMQTASISCDSNWVATTADTWISVSPLSGSGNATLNITLTANPSSSSRTGTVIVTRGNLSSTINVLQAGNGSFWCTPSMTTPNTIGVTNVTLNTINRNSGIDEGYINTGLSTTLKIDTGYTFTTTISGFVAPAVWIDWNIDGDFNDPGEAIVAPASSWYPSNSGIKSQVFTVPATATEGTTRMRVYIKKFGTGPVSSPCNLTDAGGDIEDYTIVVISHKHLTLTPTALVYTNTGNTQNVSVDTDSNWVATTAQTWISVSPNAGSGNGTSGITTTANTITVARTGLVTYTRGSYTKFVSVSQDAADTILSAAPLTINLISTGGVQSFDVTSNVSYSLSTAATWFTVSNSTGTGDFTFSIIVSGNSLLTTRTDSVVIVSGTKRAVVIITQDAASAALTASPDTLFYGSNGGNQSATINTAAGWTASTGDAWVIITPNSGSGNGSINVEADTNATGSQRFGYISITNGITTVSVVVKQDANITTQINASMAESEISVYPNPVSETIFIAVKEKIDFAEVTDLQGKILRKEYLQNNSVSVKELESGIYFLRIYAGDKVLVKKFVKD
ncbi:MAG: C10 family peptidase [Bacteroidia bacterium]|nr:C10 family peptidase [Bacteroidia bacterium]